MKHLFGLPIHEIIIPIISFTLISLQYLYLIYVGAYNTSFQHNSNYNLNKHINSTHKRIYPYHFFSIARVGWVVQNYLTGQAAANSTRFVSLLVGLLVS